jgi:dTDP-4-dehydrorhamnose 3,5-epimerase
MIFRPTPIHGAYVVELEPHADSRGSFARAYCKREFEAAGIDFDILQCNLAHSLHAGVVRGLHYQEEPMQESKLVRCIRGAVLDAMVDMRTDSATYRATTWVRLDETNRLAIFVPGGVAHGYQVLEDNSLFLYMTDQYYAPGFEKGVRFDDPTVRIPWPLPPRDVAARDLTWPLLEEQRQDDFRSL